MEQKAKSAYLTVLTELFCHLGQNEIRPQRVMSNFENSIKAAVKDVLGVDCCSCFFHYAQVRVIFVNFLII